MAQNEKSLRNELELICELENLFCETSKDDIQKILSFINATSFTTNARNFKQLLLTVDALVTLNRIDIQVAYHILLQYKDLIIKYIGTNELLNFFEHPQLILFLLENDIVDFQSVNDERCEDVNYFFFFFPEIRKDLYFFYSILNENPELIPVIEKIDIEQHYMLRKRGCNENPLAVLIRNDNIDELTREINAKNVNTTLDYSYYERFEFVNSKSDMPTLIEYSAFFGSIKSFKFLLNCNARINNDLPQFAVAGGNVEIIRICIEKKLVFDDECFEVAIRYHQNSIVEYFHRELNKSFSRKSVLLSVKSHNYQQFLSLLDQYTSTSPNYNEDDEDEMLFYKEDQSINSKIDGCPLIIMAINRGYLEISEYIAQQFPNLKIDNKLEPKLNALNYAVLIDRLDIVKFIYDQQIDKAKFIKDKNTTSSFFDAARQSRPEILKYLAYLDNFDPNKSKDDNYTILHIAVYNDSINVIKAIFEIHKKKPISLNAKLYTNQYTSLHLAVSKHFIRSVKLLISHDEIDVNAHSKRGITPLHLAVEVGDLEIVKVLAAHPKVDINAKAFKGYTPLHFAIKKERMEILKYLSSLPQIDLNALNNDGESPLFYAVRKAHKDSIAFFDEIFQSKRYHLRKLEQEGIIFDNMNN